MSMEYDSYLRFVLALLLVLGLIAILAWLLRRFGFGGALRADNRRRLQVLESAPIGPRHRLVLIRRDQVEHLLLLGPQGDLVVERGIHRQDFEKEMARAAPDKSSSHDPARHEPPPLRLDNDSVSPTKDAHKS
jgi:flagellar protein FliO/FliZ